MPLIPFLSNGVISLFFFVIGTFFGSFLNVLIDRLPRNESILISRSYCESCKKKLQWLDLFPVFSYLFLWGKCRYCKAVIPLRIFIVEIITGILFVALTSVASPLLSPFVFFLYAAIACCLVVIFFVDLEQGIISDQMLIALLILSIVLHLFVPFSTLPTYFLSAVGSFLFFLAIYLVTKGKGMGLGDVKFAFVIGLFLGFPNALFTFYLAFLTGAIVSLILVILRKKRFKKDSIPFGPFLVAGIVFTFIFGDIIKSFVPFL